MKKTPRNPTNIKPYKPANQATGIQTIQSVPKFEKMPPLVHLSLNRELEVCQENNIGTCKDYEAGPSGIVAIGLLCGTNILTTPHVEDGTLKQHFARSVYSQITFEGLSRGKRFTREAV